jgi:hypothetical protein
MLSLNREDAKARRRRQGPLEHFTLNCDSGLTAEHAEDAEQEAI